jgi:beta,beta-carotene 9',10'-dioxygenase
MANYFKSLDQEIETEIQVTGAIPEWLNGVLLRNGPAKFEQADKPFAHWFDGYAMLHRFELRAGKVFYKNRFLQSTTYQTDCAQNIISTNGTGTLKNPCASIFGKFFNLFKPTLVDNNNVNIIDFQDKYFAVSDYSTLVEFDVDSLETKGLHTFNDAIGDKFMLSAAHPCVDAATGELFNYLCELGPTVKYHITAMDMQTGKRRLLTSFARPYPAVIHSTALTPNYYIVVECPAKINFWDLWFADFRKKTFSDVISWHDDEPTRFYIIDRKTGETTILAHESFFFFHTINAFERDGTIYIDVCRAETGDLMRDYYIEKLLSSGISLDNAMRPARFGLHLAEKRISWTFLSSEYTDLPQINPIFATKPYEFAYMVGINTAANDFLYNQLVKLNVETGEQLFWREAGAFPGEPVFVAAPSPVCEDDGLILSVVLDNTGSKSFLLVLDARSFTEIARAEIPHLIPMGLHGCFVEKTAAVPKRTGVQVFEM